MRYKLTIAYDGTHFGGWQIQSNAVSIQQLIEEALQTALRHPTPITGAGRTDAGVHARAQVAHFDTTQEIDTFRLLASLNGLLPTDIRILKIETVSSDFHARYSAVSKEYHYHLHLDRVMLPFKRLYATPVYHPVDLNLLQQAAALFVGTHDFTAFANEADTGSAAHNPVRTLSRLDLCPEEGGVRLEFEGNGFLYKMVRNITGTLLDVTSGKIPLESLPDIFAAKDRRKAGQTAPPQGLFLMNICY
jgi:tRNA pseudouridine38-40 synthase